MSKLERATARTNRREHTVSLNGKPFEVADFDPVAMARSIKRRKKPATLAEKKARVEKLARLHGLA
ncbi:hypothetical protein ACG873_07225 [Mesorhizobium sp. AaZ16]|uniref:hypothetical protein n=1 Tax=Mesorhizobium sp. AaZ16 TaxID=3402289 RepID=UPI00374E612A